MSDGWKDVIFEGSSWLLYNLDEDPYEMVNLAHNSAYADKRLQLKDRLAQWISDTGDRFEVPKH
jgi:arylsulfatase A-like enzyme